MAAPVLNNNNKNWIIEPQVTYDVIIGRGRLSVLAGASTQKIIQMGCLQVDTAIQVMT